MEKESSQGTGGLFLDVFHRVLALFLCVPPASSSSTVQSAGCDCGPANWMMGKGMDNGTGRDRTGRDGMGIASGLDGRMREHGVERGDGHRMGIVSLFREPGGE